MMFTSFLLQPVICFGLRSTLRERHVSQATGSVPTWTQSSDGSDGSGGSVGSVFD